MSEPIRDLAVWYPLLPSGSTVPELARQILDMRVIVTLPPMDYADNDEGVGIDMCFAELVSAGSAALGVDVTLSDASVVHVDVPVYIGRDAQPAPGGSYAVCSASPANQVVSYQIHPDCVLVMQDAPELVFMDRGPVSKSDATVQPDGSRTDGKTTSPSPAALDPYAFADGCNVSVSVLDGALTFTGTPGGGSGVWTTSPFVDLSVLPDTPGKGLRSINGMTGDVILEGSSSVGITVAASGAGSSRVLTVRFKPVKG